MPGDDLSRKRQTVIDVSQRNHLETIQSEIRKSNELLTTLRRENKELQQSLQQALRGQRNIDIDAHYHKEEDLLHNKMCVLKRSLNAIKGKNVELTREIERVVEENKYVQIESNNTIIDESSPIAQKIRALENRLDKCLIKHNEVNTIRKTYETLLERLQLEQGGFDTQLSSAEKALRTTEREMQELIDVGKDAARGRDQAKAEVLALKLRLQEEHRHQRKDLEQRRVFVQEKREALEKAYHGLVRSIAQKDEHHARQLQPEKPGGKRGPRGGLGGTSGGGGGGNEGPGSPPVPPRPEDHGETAEWLLAHKTAYLSLREATMQTSVAAVIEKYLERVQTNETLKRTIAELEESLRTDRRTCEGLRERWEEANQRAGGAMVASRITRHARDQHERRRRLQAQAGSSSGGKDADPPLSSPRKPDYGLLAERANANRQVLGEFQNHLKRRQEELKAAQEKYEALSKLALNVEAGVLALAEKLALAPPPPNGVAAMPTATPHSNPTSSSPNSLSLPTGSGEVPAVLLLRHCEAKAVGLIAQLGPEELEEGGKGRAAPYGPPSTAHKSNQAPTTGGRLGSQGKSLALGGAGGLREIYHHLPSEEMNEFGIGALKGSSHQSSQSPIHAAGGGTSSPGLATVDDFPDNEIRDRHELKVMALAMVEREEKKAYKQLAQRRKEVS
ncbi:unnamed protein product [Phytomonas sp. Hart1]|nr:unnamed protein product [Phytomonas sp. Hart1]|eukprot:CCW72193.1 unnamed protein product [Phytomonas sp. isolate Hart1]